MSVPNEDQEIPYSDQRKNIGHFLTSPQPGEEVVITGVAGKFPECENVDELRDSLYNKINLISTDDRRWSYEHPEMPKTSGKLLNIDKFDCGFFGVHYRQSVTLDPMLRMLLEKAVEAIMDAGYHPSEMEGTRTGVYVGLGGSETVRVFCHDQLLEQYSAITGLNRSMLAHRISYFLKLQGSAYALDSACSSLLTALDCAYQSIRSGENNAALVAAVNLCLNPVMTQQFFRLGVLSKRGLCSPFDINADGYIRAECAGVLFLQKSKDSRRIYAQILHCKSNCDGYKIEGLTFPSTEQQTVLLCEICEELNLNPDNITYIEAHATGTLVGDPQEVKAIDAAYSKNRTTPLLIGSTKSNLGHGEVSSGLISIAKVIIAMENGAIPPNINFTSARPGLEAIHKKRLQVVTERTLLPNEHGIFGVNSFGLGGANSQAMLKWHTKNKINSGLAEDNLPRLICVSGRTKQSVTTLLDALRQHRQDQEYIRLFHQIFSKNFDNHFYRGYTILTKTGEIQRSIRYTTNTLQPLYIVFSNFSTGWMKIYEDLKEFQPLVKSLKRIDVALMAKRLSLTTLLQNCKTKTSTFDHIIGNLAIQICFADMLKLLDVHPEGTLGLGLGEFVCGYFENCLNLEETVACVYEIATVIKTSNNSLPNFQNNDFKRKVYKNLCQILPKSKSRPSRWLSKGVHKFASVEFFVESLSDELYSRTFFENLNKPSIVFEIGDGQLRSLPRRSTIINFDNILLTDSVVLLLQNLGSLYNSGRCMDLAMIYPKVEYPVSRSTPMISPCIKWDHSKVWYVKKHEPTISYGNEESHITVDISSEDYSYITGHIVDGRNLFPATGYLYLVWEALAFKIGSHLKDMIVVFRDCRILRATTITKDHKVEFTVTLKSAYFNFEVLEENTLVMTGKIFITKNAKEYQVNLPPNESLDCSIKLETTDIYKELRLRGYYYKDDFCGLTECSIDGLNGKIRWIGNWVTFLDNMLQLSILQMDSRNLYVPVSIQQVVIDAPEHLRQTLESGADQQVPVSVYKQNNVIKSGGIEIRGVKASRIAKKRALERPLLEKYQFVPFEANLELQIAVRVDIQLALEQTPALNVKIAELIDEHANCQPLASIIFDLLSDSPLVHPDITVFTKQHLDLSNINVEDRHLHEENQFFLIVATNLTQRELMLNQAIKSLLENGYLLSREPLDFRASQFKNPHLRILTIYTNHEEKLVLCQKFRPNNRVPLIVHVDNLEEFTWLPELQNALKTNEDVLIYSQNQPQNGILGLLNCIRRETSSKNVRGVLINDAQAPKFNFNDQFYKQQLQKQLCVNVYQNGEWGTYRHLKIDPLDEIECEHCIGNTLINGDLSSLRWIQGPLKFNAKLEPQKKLVHVYYSSLNFRDIMIASGRIHAENPVRYKAEFSQGLEFVGRDSSGKRLMGITFNGGLTNLKAEDNSLLWPVPDKWTMEDAVTVPVVYSTVLYSLFVRSSIKPGNSILIHSGTGGVGQAAISLCLHHGCKVFTTVGTQEKRKFLKKRFPTLTDNVIGSSRDTSFEQMIYRETNGRGVDYVLNSLAEEKVFASVRCLARGGHFLEIGKFDFENNNSLYLMLLEKEATFSGIMLDHLYQWRNSSIRKQLRRLIYECIDNGSVQPLNRIVFEKEELEKAFRFMTSGKHMGKVLVKIRDEEVEKIIKPLPIKMKGVPRYRCDPDKTAVILGGLGGFGLELADWLILRGARNLVLASRTGIKTGYQACRIRIWKSYGVTLLISKADITTKLGCEQLITEAEQLGPVESIFNLAVILKDAILENQTRESFKTSFAPKAYATRYLDEITRKRCPQLRDFVVFSSVSCGRGNGGQTNYGMSNSVMERICEKRKRDGYPALAIQWGPVDDVGLAAEMQDNEKILEIGGTLPQRIISCLEVLDIFLNQNDIIVSSVVLASKRSGVISLVEMVAMLMGIKDLKTVSLYSTLAQLGMDSMSGVEIKQTLEREFQIFLSSHEIRNLTFSKLYEIQNKSSTDNETEAVINDKPVEGFEMLISQIIKEFITNQELVELQTKSDRQPDAGTVLFFPGIEGIAQTLLPLTTNLYSRAISVQYPIKNPKDTVEEIAAALLPHILSIVKKSEPFYIVGYSFGTSIALEVIQKLEAIDYYGHLICLDAGPELYKKAFTTHLGHGTDEDTFQTNFLCSALSLYIKQEVIIRNQEAISKCKSFDERLDIIESILPAKGKLTPNQLRKSAISAYKRLVAVLNYKFQCKLKKTSIRLFKPEILMVNGLSDDYGLSECCGQTVGVQVFKGNHISILENPDVAAAIDLWAGTRTHNEKT